MRTSKRRAAAAGVALACFGAHGVAQAQEMAAAPAGAQVAPNENTSYGPEFFASYSVNNAEDMLRIIPGVQAILNEQSQQNAVRGFGSGGARILLNGRRFPGKANEIGGNLRRLPANAVARVELISGQTEGITVNSQGMLVNIVLREGVSLAGSGAWELNARIQNEKGKVEWDGLVSYKGAVGALSYSLGLERTAQQTNFNFQSIFNFGIRERDETFFYSSGALQEQRDQISTLTYKRLVQTAGLTYDLKSGARIELNAYHEEREARQFDPTLFTRYSTAGAATLAGLDYHERGTIPAEISELSGEFTSAIGPGDLQALFIVHRERRNTLDFRNLTTPAGLRELNRTLTDADTGEDIGRISYALPLAAGQSIEIGGEAARNTQQSQLLASFDADGNGLLDITPNQISNVEEKRAELFVTHKWAISPALSLESALNYEASKITSVFRVAGLSSVTPERSLSFPKPSFDLRYRPSAQVQYRLRVERTISQLQFLNFVPSLNVENNVIIEGNPFLRPEKAWTVEVGYERRLPGDAGLLEARAFYSQIADAIDKAPMVSPLGGVLAVQGNIASARSYGAEVKTSVRLGFMGMPDSLLSLRYLLQDSEVRDPFTGETRRLIADRGYQFDVSYRQDLRALRASFGFNYRDTGDAVYSTDLIGPNVLRQYLATEPTLDVFLEKRLIGSTVLRIEAQNLARFAERRGRYYSPLASPLASTLRYETYDDQRQARGTVRLRGTF